MKFSLNKTALLLASALTSSTVAASAVNSTEIKHTIVSKKLGLELNTNKVHATNPLKKQSDLNLGAVTFNWNNSTSIKVPKFAKSKERFDKKSLFDHYFKEVAHKHGASKASIESSEFQIVHSKGIGIARYKQHANGIEVFGREINVLTNKINKFVASTGYFTHVTRSPSQSFKLSEKGALSAGFFENTGENLNKSFVLSKQQQFGKLTSFVKSNHYKMTSNSRVKKVYFPQGTSTLLPAYYVEVETQKDGAKDSKWFSYVIDANNGKVLFKNNLTAHVSTTYKVFAETSGDNFPLDGPHGNDFTPHPTGELGDTPPIGESYVSPNTVTLEHGPISTQDPWLTDSDTTTTGNNVDAYADISGEDGFDAEDVRPEMTSANAFEYDFATFSDGLTGDGQKHAVVNLFYVNNFLHDWFYDNGFDEIAGNAQQSNYGRGGVEGDRLRVEAQDSSGTNNANMSTPSDGGTPRMQMFLWDILSDSGVEVTGVSNISTGTAAFGPEEFDVSGVMSLVDDGTDPIGDGCETISDNLTGLIAIIDRGNCNFTVKVKNAQDQGAIGVIVVNNLAEADGGGVMNMGGDDATINIPSLFVSLEKGQEIKDALALDATLQARLFNEAKPLDGTLDHGIVAHEWGHYLTNRLVGNANGLSNNQGGGMGEGWSDFVALLMQVREQDNLIPGNDQFQGVYSASTFIGNAYYGIRRVPYTTDMTKNALTFKHIENGVSLPLTHPVAFGVSGANNAQVHATGTVWANMLWEVFVALVNSPNYSFDQAREKMKDYLVAGLKMTPNAPTLVEARDAMLAAVIANNVDDFVLVRDAFIKRGMGAGAVAPDRNSTNHEGVVEDFAAGVDLNSAIVPQLNTIDIQSCDADTVWDSGESVTVNLTYSSFAATAIPSFNVDLSSSNDVSFDSSTVNLAAIAGFGDQVSQSFEVTLNSGSFEEAITITATPQQIGGNPDDFVEPAPISFTLMSNFDFQKANYSDDMSVARASGFDWNTSFDQGVTGFVVDSGRWYGTDSGAPGASDLITPVIKVGATGDFSVSFDHFYQFESSDDSQGEFKNWDGGVIEVSVDGGAWQDVVEAGATLGEAYNGVLDAFNGVLGGRNAYVYTRDPDNLVMTANSVTFPEGLVNGKDIQLRFRIGTDENTGEFGWLIDNFVVTNATSPMFSNIIAEDDVCLSGNAPVVDAGTDQSINVGNSTEVTVELSGTATDADGDALTIEWIQRAGPAVTLTNSDTLQPSFIVSAPSQSTSFEFELSVSDGGFTRTDRVSVALNVNSAPTVTASGSTVTEGQTANLTATANDADGDTLTYTWTQTGGPTVTLSNANSSNPSFTAPQVDSTTTLTFEVVVNDGTVDSAPATASVTVNNQAEPPASGGSSSGGGSLSALMLLALAGLSRRRKQK